MEVIEAAEVVSVAVDGDSVVEPVSDDDRDTTESSEGKVGYAKSAKFTIANGRLCDFAKAAISR